MRAIASGGLSLSASLLTLNDHSYVLDAGVQKLRQDAADTQEHNHGHCIFRRPHSFCMGAGKRARDIRKL